MRNMRAAALSTTVLAALGATPAIAGEWEWGGFVRDETAFSTTGRGDPFNQNANLFNGVPTARNGLFPDTTARLPQQTSQTINLELLRGEINATWHINEDLSFVGHLRTVVDPGLYSDYSPSDFNSRAIGDLYKHPNYFVYQAQGTNHPNPLEITGHNFDIDFPALFVEYNHGPLDVRVGNQQIAWGQAIFFRILDTPDGIDFRRHSVLDYVPEEYSDKRVPSLALRVSYQISNDWLLDGFIQKFQPTVYSNPNTPYNQISSQFTVHDRYGQYDADVDEGIRVKGTLGDFGLQGIYNHRYNPDGVYRWTASGVNRDIPGLPGSGAVLAHTPFEVDSTGVWSAQEWFQYAGMARLSGVGGLNAAITDFEPYTGLLGAAPVGNSYAAARKELDTFFQLAGGAAIGQSNAGLRGHIERQYRPENDIGGGVSYVTNGAPGSLLDQLIINVEALYVPDRTFTSPTLGHDFIRRGELTTALVLEKYQRFFQAFPATYLVGQFLYKSQSDLFGRYLGGYGGSAGHSATGVGGGFKAIALAVQQPFPNLIWRADFAALIDVRGGLLLQPAIRWKPRGNVSVEMFYNYLNGRLGKNPNNNIISGVDYADELTLRLTYQF